MLSCPSMSDVSGAENAANLYSVINKCCNCKYCLGLHLIDNFCLLTQKYSILKIHLIMN